MDRGYVAPIDGAIHLDGLLSAACLSLYASVIDGAIDRYVVPLPLVLAWVSPAGDPLWLATEMRPIGEWRAGAAYLHSRYPTDRAELAKRQAVLTAAGRYKDTRLPLAITLAERIEGWCIGDRAAVAGLLARVQNIGRKAAHGRGRVLAWSVQPAPDITEADILDRRNVPVEYLASRGISIDGRRLAPRLGWTPPYWHAASQAPVRTAAWTR